MNQARWETLQEIFWSARLLPEAERDAYLTLACGEDGGLRDEVRRMLVADRASGVLDQTPSLFTPRAPPTQPISERIGPYVITEEIGRGGMGVVFRAYDPRLQRDVALKFLKPGADRDVAANARFINEARTASALDHPHHCPVYDIGTVDDGRLYIAMAYCAGGSLAQRLASGPLSVTAAVDIAIAVADALERAHEAGIVHRDIKPANIAFTERGDVRVLDFGIAILGSATGAFAGTPGYMAPEQERGEPGDRRSDVWSLAVVLFEMLTGQRPDQAAGLRFRPDMPPAVVRVIRRALESEPSRRFATAAEFGGALRRARSEMTPRPGARRTIALATGVVVVAAVSGYLMLRRSESTTAARPLDANAVVVLPFRVSGDPSLGYLREGMMDLLAAKLPGEGGLRALDPRSVYGALPQREGEAGKDLSDREAATLAQRLGAANVLRGSVVGSGGNLLVSASVVAVDGKVLGRGTAQGMQSSLSEIVDQLVAQLLSGSAGEEPQRLAALTSTSLPALRAYLDGQAAYRRGRYSAALDHFGRALDLDSTFALAGLGLDLADGWVGTRHAAARGLAVAWRWRERLSARDRALLEVSAGSDYPRPPTVIEQLDATERALRLAPDRAELWYTLGDLHFHYGRMFGASQWEARAERGFLRALELDPDFTGVRQHLVQLYARQGRTEMLRAAAADAIAREPHGPAADYIRWRAQLELSSAAPPNFAVLDSLAIETLGWIGMNTQDDGFALETGRQALLMRNSRPGTREQRLERMLSLHAAALNAGRRADALMISDSLRALQSDSAFYLRLRILSALYGDGDRDAAEHAAALLMNVHDGSGERLNRCVLDQWQASGLGRTRAEPVLEAAPPAKATVEERVCNAALVALHARPGDPRKRQALRELEELYRSGPLDFFPGDGHVDLAPLVLAAVLEAAGDRAAALAALRSRPYFIGWQPFLATSLREEARLAEQLGDREGAARARQHYLAFRPHQQAD